MERYKRKKQKFRYRNGIRRCSLRSRIAGKREYFQKCLFYMKINHHLSWINCWFHFIYVNYSPQQQRNSFFSIFFLLMPYIWHANANADAVLSWCFCLTWKRCTKYFARIRTVRISDSKGKRQTAKNKFLQLSTEIHLIMAHIIQRIREHRIEHQELPNCI